jgi:hypothetical protein
VSGNVIKHQDKEFMLVLKVLVMMVNGKMINNMVLVLKHFLMELAMRVTTKIHLNVDKENTFGLTARNMKENGTRIKFMV